MTLQMTVWNVEHGSAIHIATPNGRNVVIDLGGTSDFSPLLMLKSLGMSQIDCLIVTHPHLDHIEDIVNLNESSLKTFVGPSLSLEDIVGGIKVVGPRTQEVLSKYLSIAGEYMHTADLEYALTNPINWGGANFYLFSPNQCDVGNINNRSIVTLLEYEGVKILIPGDNEECSWKELLSLPSFQFLVGGTHVFVASHHGRESGFYSKLFEYFKPCLTVVSDGRAPDTGATSRYSSVSRGWNVSKRGGGSETRFCITTRKDGRIAIRVAPTTHGSIGSLDVEVD